jgi:hypothetical protein
MACHKHFYVARRFLEHHKIRVKWLYEDILVYDNLKRSVEILSLTYEYILKIN